MCIKLDPSFSKWYKLEAPSHLLFGFVVFVVQRYNFSTPYFHETEQQRGLK